MIEIDPDLYAPILQGMGVIASSKSEAAARQFTDFLRGADGRKLLSSFGFGLPAQDGHP